MDTMMILELWRQLRSLRPRDRWSCAQLAAHQSSALQRLRAFAYTRSSFYQRFHAGLTARPRHVT